jgi:hypothetical protein
LNASSKRVREDHHFLFLNLKGKQFIFQVIYNIFCAFFIVLDQDEEVLFYPMLIGYFITSGQWTKEGSFFLSKLRKLRLNNGYMFISCSSGYNLRTGS